MILNVIIWVSSASTMNFDEIEIIKTGFQQIYIKFKFVLYFHILPPFLCKNATINRWLIPMPLLIEPGPGPDEHPE